MKSTIVLFFIVALLISCKKSATQPIYRSQGTLIGYDSRTCATCGGLEITIKNDTTKNAPAFYLINTIPSGLPANLSFPTNVTLNWKPDTTTLKQFGYIIITQIRVLN